MTWRTFYKTFLVPRQQHEDAANREFVLNVLVAGGVATMLFALAVLLYDYFFLDYAGAVPTIASVLVMLAISAGVYALSRSGRFKSAAYIFLGLYFLIALGVSLAWSIGMPVTVALFGLIVVLAGILLGARYSLFGFVAVFITVTALKAMEAHGMYRPDLAWATAPNGTLTGVILVFGTLAVVSWLFNVRMERSLRRAERAEAALQRQKSQLEKVVEKRTRELQEAQFEKVQELYRFAELGQLSTALMHELANHLTTLTLDIESLEAESRSRMLQRAKRSMHYIDKMVLQVRDQLRGKTRLRAFAVSAETEAVIGMLQHKAIQAGVQLIWEPPKHAKTLRVRGDTVRFRQLLTNIISNAIDAYGQAAASSRQVRVSLTSKDGNIIINVEDWGKGITPQDRPKLFDPFYGTKKGGLGLGLFIARQIAQDHFGGNVTLDASKTHTIFVIALKAYEVDR